MAGPPFLVGDPVPWFQCRSTNNQAFHFDTVAGRYVILCFFGSAAVEKNAKALAYVHGGLRALFDDRNLSFFGVSIDPADEQQRRVAQATPGIRYFWDFDHRVSRLYGALEGPAPAHQTPVAYHCFTLVLDPALRVVARIPLTEPEAHNRLLHDALTQLPPADRHAQTELVAPVLIVPRVLDSGFCRELIGLYEAGGGEESGFMRQRGDSTVGVVDYGFKRRRDHEIVDEAVRERLRSMIRRRLVPEIAKAFQYKVTHIERYIVACYEGEHGGFFRPHRDNTTRGTAHRRFACTINLNAGEYSGGGLRFPEFGSRIYQAPTGGAVVFSCSLLHEALPVTAGTRYATLPFLYDSAAAQVRLENQRYVTGEVNDLTRPSLPEDDAAIAS